MNEFLDISTNLQKGSILLIILPLISFIIYGLNIWILGLYTFLVAIHLLYIHLLISFKVEVTKDIMGLRKDNQKPFWYIPYKLLFATLTLINLILSKNTSKIL